jgi:hypothetical protein
MVWNVCLVVTKGCGVTLCTTAHHSPSESLQKPSTLCNRDKDDIKCTSLSFSVALTYDVTEPLHGNPGGGNPRRAMWGGGEGYVKYKSHEYYTPREFF